MDDVHRVTRVNSANVLNEGLRACSVNVQLLKITKSSFSFPIPASRAELERSASLLVFCWARIPGIMGW
jgi:hypothetical protein